MLKRAWKAAKIAVFITFFSMIFAVPILADKFELISEASLFYNGPARVFTTGAILFSTIFLTAYLTFRNRDKKSREKEKQDKDKKDS